LTKHPYFVIRRRNSENFNSLLAASITLPLRKNTLLPHRKQSGHTLIGYLFIGYALFTLTLAFYLSNPAPVQASTERASATQPTKPVTASKAVVVANPVMPHLQISQQPTPASSANKVKATYAERPDFGAMKNVNTKKETFFLYLLPAIESANKHMANAQKQPTEMQNQTQADQSLSSRQQQRLFRWSKEYRVDTEVPTTERINQLLERMDEIPASMVLAQGAMESAWGTSRFARLANNYFGQWCFSEGCGLVPSQRNAGASHEVATFADANAAVASYFKNINRHPAYQRVRDERHTLRKAGDTLDSLAMVRGLDKYSARGHAYTEELQSMIRYNNIKRFD